MKPFGLKTSILVAQEILSIARGPSLEVFQNVVF